jgi:predicted nucleic acid-binding protein
LRRRKPIYVLDATATIILAKIGKLHLVSDISEAYITEEVRSETVGRGRDPDSLVIRDQLESGGLRVYDVRERGSVDALLRHTEIHRGEAETLAAARELDGTAVVDEKEARMLARIYGIKTAPGTLFLLFRLLNLGKLTADEADETLNSLVAAGLYLDPKTLLRAQEKLREYRTERRR